MAVSANPTLTQVKTEFGGPDNLTAYVRGGAYVPDTPANAAIATTAANLKLSQFANAVKTSLPPTPYLADVNSSDAWRTGGAGSATVTMTLKTTGSLQVVESGNGYTYDAYQWLPSGRTASEYQFRTSYDNVNWSSWATISANYDVLYVNASTDGFYSDYQSTTVYLQLGAGGTVLASCILTGDATAEGRL